LNKSNLERAEELAVDIEDETELSEVISKIRSAFDQLEHDLLEKEPVQPRPILDVAKMDLIDIVSMLYVQISRARKAQLRGQVN